MSLADDLRAARALIDAPEKWQRKAYHDAAYSCFCVYGALDHAAGGEFQAATETVEALRAALPPLHYSLVDFNDARSTTHADIMALFDRAIQRAETTPSNDQQNEREQT